MTLLVSQVRSLRNGKVTFNELIDGLYHINAKNMQKERFTNITDFNLVIGILNNINEEIEKLIQPRWNPWFILYYYVSNMDEKNTEPTSMADTCTKIDRKVFTVTPIKWNTTIIMEIVDEAYKKLTWSKIYSWLRYV